MEPDGTAPVEGGTLLVGTDYVPQRCGDVLELDMGDGIILYSRTSDLVHHLNQSAGIVWQLCDGDASVDRMGREVAEVYEREPETMARQIAIVIAELEALGLVVDARPADGRAVVSQASRRSVPRGVAGRRSHARTSRARCK